MIERQVKELFERAAEAGPSEAGAYDRFLRRRRRRVLGAAAAACLILAVAIGLAVVLPRLEPDRRVTTTGPKPARPPAMFSRPDQGFELDLPAGWSQPRVATAPGQKSSPPIQINTPDDPMVRLELTTPRAASLQIGTGLIDPRYSGQLGIDAGGIEAPSSLDYLRPARTLTSGQRADGRRFLRTLTRQAGLPTVDWYVAWPFQCAQGPKPTCPTVLRLRVLHVNLMWSKLVTSARMLPAGRRVVEAVRPAGNAVEQSPVAGRQPCSATGPDQVGIAADYRGQTLRHPRTHATVLGPGTRTMLLRSLDYTLLACRIHGKVALEVRDGDKPAAIRYNGLALPASAKLAEQAASAPRNGWALWEWTNWCGSRSAAAWLVDPTVRPARPLVRFRVEPPPCLDPKSPPVLQYGYTR
jgi:hypothetical protein